MFCTKLAMETRREELAVILDSDIADKLLSQKVISLGHGGRTFSVNLEFSFILSQ